MNLHPGCLLVLVLTAQLASSQHWRLDSGPDGVTVNWAASVSDAPEPVLHYQRSVKSQQGKWPRNAYVHPLYGLDGKILTEDFPSDHGHHRGIFWAWHQVWVANQRLGDPWICKNFEWNVTRVDTSTTDETATILATVDWQSPDYVNAHAEMIPVVRERARIDVHRPRQGYRIVDFRIELLALLEAVRIGGSEDAKGYGGFSPRLALNSDQRFLSADGEVEPIKTAVAAAGWINITDAERGIVIQVHPENAAPRDQWILRRARSMQNAKFPGREPITLSDSTPLILRYRLIIHDGKLAEETIAKLFRHFAEMPGQKVHDESPELLQN